MAETSELTTRDVLSQINRRLTLIEDDLRGLNVRMETQGNRLDAKIEEQGNRLEGQGNRLDAKIEAQVGGLRQEMNTRFAALEARGDFLMGELRKEMNTKFIWLLGVVLATWMSTMGAVLLK